MLLIGSDGWQEGWQLFSAPQVTTPVCSHCSHRREEEGHCLWLSNSHKDKTKVDRTSNSLKEWSIHRGRGRDNVTVNQIHVWLSVRVPPGKSSQERKPTMNVEALHYKLGSQTEIKRGEERQLSTGIILSLLPYRQRCEQAASYCTDTASM